MLKTAALAGALALGAPKTAAPPDFQRLLQAFVNAQHGRAFRHLGDERDFDHGHLLFDPAGRPRALLYHTQELAMYEGEDSGFGWLDRGGRNWLQWLDDGRVENARAYERASYPSGAEWDWFRFKELPALRAHGTILPKMLDGGRLGLDVSRSEQWTFSRGQEGGPGALSVRLPDGRKVFLVLTRS